ncbi:polyglutamine-binding protein 1 [Anabrus simplex]|uniref:polyglutamine-binding protein 1 n=1 Tax=Anabrus simplex TaxID=316456 RepID=UPI0034DCFA8D
MPLPQFLRYRLAKRGILPSTGAEDVGLVEKPAPTAVTPTPAAAAPPAATEAPQPAAASLGEEVIAEDYDTNPKKTKNGSVEESDADNLLNEMQLKLWGHPGCPNKYNIYHECSAFCKERWGAGHVEMDPKYLKLRQKMLIKYPLPLNWVEVYDPGTGRYYYWEYESDFVSWLPPGHPRAVISESAPFLRDALHQEEQEDEEEEERRKSSESEEDEEDDDSVEERQERHKDDKGRKRYRDDERRSEKSSGDERKREGHDRHKSKSWRKDSDDEDGKEPRPKDRKREGSDRHKEDKDRKREGYEKKSWKKAFDKTLDPMDPAAYSDTPRGSWSSGIERKNEAKTGADTTASGPLYQMRPYPSPGDVLRANSKSKHSHEKPSKGRRDST